MRTRASPVPGFQIAFLVFALVFLNAPLDAFVYRQWQWARDLELDLGRALMVMSGGIVLAVVSPLRRQCSLLLGPRIPASKRREVALALASGGCALTLERHARAPQALQPAFVIQRRIAVEELVFRGLLYRAWRVSWGWAWAAIASSVVFGLFHGLVIPQFLSGLVLVAAMRRSGSLRTSIYTHALFNMLAWYPLLGQFMFPPGRSTGELPVWTPLLICLALAIVLLPLYMWSAREAKLPRHDAFAAEPIA